MICGRRQAHVPRCALNPTSHFLQAEREDGRDAGGAEPMDGMAPSAAAAAAAAAAGQAGDGADAAAELATDQWVQCDRCRTWRIVPDSEWPKVEADPRDVRPPQYPIPPHLHGSSTLQAALHPAHRI